MALLALVVAIASGACTGELATGREVELPPADPDGGLPDVAVDASVMNRPDATEGIDATSPVASVVIAGPPVRAHVQAFVDAACAAVGSCEALTYVGHDPSADLAVDLVVSDTLGELPSDGNALGDALAAYALEQQVTYGIRYVIWRQRINLGSGWDAMEDRGSITQNHYDHVHISFHPRP